MAQFALFENVSLDGDGSVKKDLSPEDYVEKHQLHLYVKDAVKLVLGRRDERPITTVYEYFKSIINGDNVCSREYAYISATQRNRLAFISHLGNCYPHLSDSESLTPDDYHQLLCFVCPDFPKSVVGEALNGLKDEGYNYGTISRMVMIYFFYHEFFKEIRSIFNAMANTDRRSRSVTTPGTVPLGDFVTAIRLICYKTDDISASSSIVLALAESKNRPKKLSVVYPPVHVISAAIFLTKAPMSLINQKMKKKKEEEMDDNTNSLKRDGKSPSSKLNNGTKSLNRIVADELSKKSDEANDNSDLDKTRANEKEIESWDSKPITWSEMLSSILQQDVLLRQLKSKNGAMLPGLVETAVFPRRKDERRAALARTLLTQLRESNETSNTETTTKGKSSTSSKFSNSQEGNSSKRRKSRSRSRR